MRSSQLVSILEKFAADNGVKVQVQFVDAAELGHAGGQAEHGSIKLTKGLWTDIPKLAWVYCHELAHHKLGHVPGPAVRTLAERAAAHEPGSPGYRMWLAMANNRYERNEEAANNWADAVAPAIEGLIVLVDTNERLEQRIASWN